MKKNFWKIASGAAVSAAGIGLMMHWGSLGFVVGSMMAAVWFENAYGEQRKRNRGAVMRRQSTNHLFMSVISWFQNHIAALHLSGRG